MTPSIINLQTIIVMSAKQVLSVLNVLFLTTAFCAAQVRIPEVDTVPYAKYPDVVETQPDLPSPFMVQDGKTYIVAVTHEDKYAIMEVTLRDDNGICPQLIVDTADFPALARTGLHDNKTLKKLKTITGCSLAEITALGRPNGLSQAGFMASDETIQSVLKADNEIVGRMGLTHPQLAKPLFQVLNMMATDLSLNRWNMARHRWENIRYFYYNGQQVFVEAEDTKGGQQSIFDDQIGGGFYIKLWRSFNEEELDFLAERYKHLSEAELTDLKTRLSAMNTGEMQPQYIMRYGFYEGHTFWRTDSIAIAFIFGLKSLPELDEMFKNRLYKVLSDHFLE
jgi:hypothetical protein